MYILNCQSCKIAAVLCSSCFEFIFSPPSAVPLRLWLQFRRLHQQTHSCSVTLEENQYGRRAVSLCETTKMQRENLFARLTGLIFYSTQLIACFLCAATHGNTNSPWLLLLWSGPGLCSDLLFPMTEVDDGNTEYYFLWSTAPAVWHSHIFYVPAVCPCRDRARPHERGGVFRVWKFTDWVPFQPRRSGLQPRGGRGSQV